MLPLKSLPKWFAGPAFVLLCSNLIACLDMGDSSDAGVVGANGGGSTTTTSNCTTSYTPCGGDLTGTWAVQSICAVEGSPTTALNGIFAAQSDCSGAGLSAAMTASGQKTYNSGTLASSEAFTLAETISMSDACLTSSSACH